MASSPWGPAAGGQGGAEARWARLGVLTWGIDQGHVVPDAQPRLLRQSGGHPLGLPVQLDAGRCACDRALGSGEGVSTGPAEPAPRPARPRGAAHLGVQQQKQGVVGGGVGPPLQHVRQEQELAEARGSAPPRLPPPKETRPSPAPPTGRRAPHPPGAGPSPSSPGRCPPGEPAPAPRPVRSSSRRPDSQGPWRQGRPLGGGGAV